MANEQFFSSIKLHFNVRGDDDVRFVLDQHA